MKGEETTSNRGTYYQFQALEGLHAALEDIVFTHADASWVHHPYEDALVIIAEVANSLVHQLLVDSGSAINILYWDAYHKVGLR